MMSGRWRSWHSRSASWGPDEERGEGLLAAEREAARMGDPHLTAEVAWSRRSRRVPGSHGDDGARWPERGGARSLAQHG